MNYRSDNPHTDWPETMAVIYRSEAFAEDLDDFVQPAPQWRPRDHLLAVLPMLCLLAPVADAYFR